MKVLKAVVLIFIFTAVVANAQDKFSAIDFFMHDRFHDTFLRDYYRFQEPLPLRIEYYYVNWLDSSERADDHRDQLHIEGMIPIYRGLDGRLIVDVPIRYSRIPIWSETEEITLGRRLNIIEPHLTSRWVITDRLKSIVGWEYNMKGDDDSIGESNGREICLLKALFSYDLHRQLNLVAGLRFDRYYYDIDEEPDAVSYKLTDRLYYQPAIMLNWHPSNSLIVLLGIPGSGIYAALGQVLKAEVRASIDERIEVALRAMPLEKTRATLRFLNSPYAEFPIMSTNLSEDKSPAERLSYTSKSFIFEIGRELNPAALASLGLLYSPGSDVNLKDRDQKDVMTLDGKSRFAIGATFIMDIQALVEKR